MARERTVAPMSGFFKFTKIGQSVAGMIRDHRTVRTSDGESTFIVMRPVLIHDGSKKSGSPLYERYESAAIGLSTDLKLKIKANDVGGIVRITFTDTEASRKGNPRKIFLVEDLDNAEIRALNETAGHDNDATPYFPPEEKKSEPGSPLDETGDDDDDLPF